MSQNTTYSSCGKAQQTTLPSPEGAPLSRGGETVGDAGGGKPVRHWFIAVTEPMREKKTRDFLVARGYDAFVASRTEAKLWANRQRKLIERVVITRYVFVRLTEAERLQVVQLPQVLFFLVDRSREKNALGHAPAATIGDDDIRLLRLMLNAGDSDVMFTPADLTVGRRVMLMGYGDGDIEAEVVKVPGSRQQYVGVRLACLGCAYMQVPVERIRSIKKGS